MTLSAPEAISPLHLTETFSCGVAELDAWLRNRALRNQGGGASRTYVVSDERAVVAYYAMASGSMALIEATGRFRRNMPDPIPIIVLGRLAVDTAYQGRGLGADLLQDCAKRVIHMADQVGVRGLVVHAKSQGLKAYYESWGFRSSPERPLTMMATVADLQSYL